MLVFPVCKINLGLSIIRRRDDGYHDLETVFYPLKGLQDALEVVPAQGTQTTLQLSGRSVAGSQDSNLVWKAYQLLQQQFPDRLQPVDLYLHKVIPMGAGLGGGSADGAFALRLLNDFCSLGLDEETLAGLALQLGSDCPFFIRSTPQFAAGRGEQLIPLPLDLSAYSIQLICPDVHVSTAAAFARIVPRPALFDLRRLAALPLTEWRDRVVNDFEAPVFAQHPELALIKEQLYAGGAHYASMSGSGSAVFGIFERGKRADIPAGEVYYMERL